MACLLLLLAMSFCEPGDSYLVKQHVDYSVGLYFREYQLKDKLIETIYQVMTADLKDDVIDVYPEPLMVRISGTTYTVSCGGTSRCKLSPY